MTINALAISSLKHIQIAVEARDQAAPFRTFLDNFFAYYFGRPFLNQNGRPHWLNAPCPKRHRDALMNLHFISIPAMRVLAGLSDEPLVRDHAIPVAVIRDLLMNTPQPRLEVIECYVRNFYRLGLITRLEDEQLTAAGLRSRMPDGWSPHHGPFCRYNKVGIVAQQLREGL